MYICVVSIILFLVFCVVAKKLFKYVLFKPKSLQGEIALVTGGGGFLGRKICMKLAEEGVKVIIWDINEEGMKETIKLIEERGGKAFGYKCNLCDRYDIYKVAAQTIEDIGDVTILVNNAGVLFGGLIQHIPDDLIIKTFELNILAHFWTVKSFLPKMITKNHGHIVTIASGAGLFGTPKLTDYCSSKFAAVGLDESLRCELYYTGVTGVKTTVVCPFFLKNSGMFDNVKSRQKPLEVDYVASEVVKAIQYNEPIVRLGEAPLALFAKLFLPCKVYAGLFFFALPDPRPSVRTNEKAKEN